MKETARLTDQRVELDENAKTDLDRKLRLVLERLPEQPEASIPYFQPDECKESGAYRTVTGCVKKYDEYTRTSTLADGRTIGVEDILELEGELFQALLGPDGLI